MSSSARGASPIFGLFHARLLRMCLCACIAYANSFIFVFDTSAKLFDTSRVVQDGPKSFSRLYDSDSNSWMWQCFCPPPKLTSLVTVSAHPSITCLCFAWLLCSVLQAVDGDVKDLPNFLTTPGWFRTRRKVFTDCVKHIQLLIVAIALLRRGHKLCHSFSSPSHHQP